MKYNLVYWDLNHISLIQLLILFYLKNSSLPGVNRVDPQDGLSLRVGFARGMTNA